MLNLPQLLQAVSTEQPCGSDLTYSAEMDKIAHARIEDDPALDQGVWVAALRQADWPLVASQCTSLIETRSKDMRLAVWLAEALAHTEGPRGLGDGFALLAGLCEQFWAGLYPLPEDGDFDQRSGNLRWLLQRTPALMLLWQQSHGPVSHSDTGYCLDKLQQLEKVCEQLLGEDGPSFSAARDSVAALEVYGGDSGAALLPTESKLNLASASQYRSDGTIQNRQQALAELRRVAIYFRNAEPYSPVAYLAEKAVKWGEMPLHNWLKEVVKDGSQLSQLELLLGVTSAD